MINRVVLVGRLVRDPELRRSPSGVSVVNFTIAVDNRFAKQDSPNKTDFIPCVVFNRTAEIAAQYSKKGTLVGVEGRISTRNYENNEGKKVYVTEVSVDSFQLLSSKNSNETAGGFNQTNNMGGYAPDVDHGFTNGFSQNNNNASNFDDFGSSGIDVSDDELPF